MHISSKENSPCKQWYNKVKLNNSVVNMIYYQSRKEMGLTQGDEHIRKQDSTEDLHHAESPET